MSRFPIGFLASAGAAFGVALVASATSGTNLASYTFSNIDFGEEDATRELLVVFAVRMSTSRTVSAVSIGGVAASFETPVTSGGVYLFTVARVALPTGVSGDISIDLSGSVNAASIAVYRLVNRAVAGAGATDAASATFSSVASVAITGVDIANGGFAVSAIMWGNSISGPGLSGLGGVLDAVHEPDTGQKAAFGHSAIQSPAVSGGSLTWSWTTSRSGIAVSWSFK